MRLIQRIISSKISHCYLDNRSSERATLNGFGEIFINVASIMYGYYLINDLA